MQAGQLRHRITLQRQSASQDEFGAPLDDWTDDATVWADIQPLTGREYFSAQQVNAEITHRILIRYRSGIVPTMRAQYGERIFGIESVLDPGERSELLHLMCIERNPEDI